ncbi:MAG: extracellular solute-binding protein [Clostridiales bacterium]|nr:extracellular solute-binding protein [Clostridiales bacterium]
MKKFVSLFLALVMVFCATASLAEIEITTEEITLTYVSCDEDYELTCALADQFEEKYPNITVEVLEMDSSTYVESLSNLAAEQKLPDVFWMDNVCDAVANGWALLLDDFYANDPDAQMISQSILDVAQIRGKRFSVPAKSRPIIAVVNKTVFDQYNMELPDPDWTWEDFVQIAEEIAHPEDYVFGYGNNMTVEYWMPRHEYDGNSYTMGETWQMLEETFADWRVRGIAENMTADEKIAVLGDAGAYPFSAINLQSSIWGAAGFIDGSMAQQTGCEFLIYPVPGPMNTNPDETWFACISKGTKYPNEAWELAKWMNWNKEAHLLRNKWYQENEIVQFALPLIDDEDVWADTKARALPSMETFYNHVKPLAPRIDPHAPAILWVNVMFYFGGVPQKFANGETTPADIAPQLREEYNGYMEDWFVGIPEFATATDLDVTE